MRAIGIARPFFTVVSEEDDTDSARDNSDLLRDAISKLVLRDLLERQEEEDDSDRVQLLTLHAAKGLEFPHVFIMGWEEESSHRNSIESDQIAERRPLGLCGHHARAAHTDADFGAQTQTIR